MIQEPRRRGFTLIELLVVIAIIAILIAPALARRPGGPRGGPADAVHQQHEAARPGDLSTTSRPTAAFPPRRSSSTPPRRDALDERLGPFRPDLAYIEQYGHIRRVQLQRCVRRPEQPHRDGPGDRDLTSARARSRPTSINNVSFGLTGATNYGFCLGDWFVWSGPRRRPLTRTAFGPNMSRPLGGLHRRHQPDDLRSPRSRTMQPYICDCGRLSLTSTTPTTSRAPTPTR